MRSLNGRELTSFIKERQAKQVRRLRQQYDITPKLAIVVTVDNPVIDVYMRLKKRYGADILVDVDIYRIKQAEAKEIIPRLNEDDSVNAIIVQLPLDDPAQTEEVVNLISPAKDVDGLGRDP